MRDTCHRSQGSRLESLRCLRLFHASASVSQRHCRKRAVIEVESGMTFIIVAVKLWHMLVLIVLSDHHGRGCWFEAAPRRGAERRTIYAYLYNAELELETVVYNPSSGQSAVPTSKPVSWWSKKKWVQSQSTWKSLVSDVAWMVGSKVCLHRFDPDKTRHLKSS